MTTDDNKIEELNSTYDNKNKKETKNRWAAIACTAMACATLGVASISALGVKSPDIISSTSTDYSRASYNYDEKSPLENKWSSEKAYKYLVNTPGAAIAGDENSVSRISTKDGSRIWEYKADNGKLCHISELNGNIAALFNNGKGCTDIVSLNAATGEIINQAQYYVSDKEEPARLVYGRDKIAIVTPHFVRLLRDDLVPVAEFGNKEDFTYTDDQSVKDCNISDVAIGPDSFAVSAMCAGDTTYHVRVVENEPEESSQGKIVVDVDTSSESPVTVPLVSKSMFNFVTNTTNPSVYTWQLDKEKAEVSSNPLQPGEFSYGYIDMKGIGYVWRIGSTIHVRHGSEDLSKSKTHSEAIGNPIQVEDKMIIPQKDSISIWNPISEINKKVNVDGLSGKYFTFSGDTLISLQDNGILKGYSPKDSN